LPSRARHRVADGVVEHVPVHDVDRQGDTHVLVIDIDFRSGDVLRISCPFTPAVVTGVSNDHVAVRWPWWQADPELDWIEWNGDVAIARDHGTPGWADELYRTEPPAEHLRIGESCRVGIPPTIVHVIEVQYFDPPLETGWLPRPNRELLVLREGVSQNWDLVDQGYGLNPDDDIPLEFELVFRPNALLDLVLISATTWSTSWAGPGASMDRGIGTFTTAQVEARPGR